MNSRFVFNLKERNGIFYILILLVFGLTTFGIYKFYQPFQSGFDNQKTELLLKKDTLPAKTSAANQWKFNPNYINDYSGYVLGLSTTQIDALIAYKASGQYINSAKDFQKVTGVSDSLLATLATRFRFPSTKKFKKKYTNTSYQKHKAVYKQDLNQADSTALTTVYGVGPVLAARIVKYRKFLGGFIHENQLNEVYGLKPEVVKKVQEKFTIRSKPAIIQRDINNISLRDLANIPYISKNLAKKIIAYRSKVGAIRELKELTKLQDFPTKQIHIIEVYLSIK